MKRSLVLLGLVLALGVSVAAGAEASPSTTERLEPLDQQVLRGLNTTRAKHGLRALVMSDDLQRAAVAHSRAMLAKGFFAHDLPGGAPFAARVKGFYRPAGYSSWSIGENLLYTTAEITADAAMKAWLDSPGHRENMLSPKWREVGIGSLRSNAADGVFGGEPTWVITMDFGARSGKIARVQAASLTVKKPVRIGSPRKPGTRTTVARDVNRLLPQPRNSDDPGAPADDYTLFYSS